MSEGRGVCIRRRRTVGAGNMQRNLFSANEVLACYQLVHVRIKGLDKLRTTWGSSRNGESELEKILLWEVKLTLSWRPSRRILPDFPPGLTIACILGTGVVDLAQVGGVIARVVD